MASIIWKAVAEYGKTHSIEDTDRVARKLLGLGPRSAFSPKISGKDKDVWRTTEEGHHIKLESETGEIKAGMGGKFNGETLKKAFGGAKPKKSRPKSVDETAEMVAGKNNLFSNSKFRESSKKWTEARKESDKLYKKARELRDQLAKEVSFPDQESRELGRQYADLFGWYTDKGKKIKEELDQIEEERSKIQKEAAKNEHQADLMKAQQSLKELQAWEEPPLKKTDKTKFDGFTLESDIADIRNAIGRGVAQIVEMSPKEYLERCAHQIFNGSTLEHTIAGTDPAKFNKYADQMEEGEEFSIPYLNFDSRQQEGRHRALAAMMNGYETIPVAVIGNPSPKWVYEGEAKSNLFKAEQESWDDEKGPELPDDLLLEDLPDAPALAEPAESYNSEASEVTEDPGFDIWQYIESLQNETPEEKKTREAKERESYEKQERETLERRDYGQNGLLENEYPEDLRLTDQEREAIFDIYRGYKEPNHKSKASADVMNALNGMQTAEGLDRREKELEKKLAEADDMIRQRKEQGYSYANSGLAGLSRKQKMSLWNEQVAEAGHGVMIGENGIRYWQTARKQLNEELKWISLAKKIAARNEFAQGNEHYVPWRKSENANNPSYKPWERKAGDAVPAEDEEVWRTSEEGRHFKFESETGEIKAGFGGKFNGKKMGESWGTRKNGEPMRPKNPSIMTGGQHSSTKPNRLSGWMEKLSPEERRDVEIRLNGRTLAEFMNEERTSFRKRKVIERLAGTTDWSDRLKDRNFENLEPQEKKDIDFLLDSFPWADNPAYKNNPDENALHDGVSKAIENYYLSLKAKAMGVEGINIPERPKELEYAMTHKSVSEVIASQNGGYIHTEAGNAHRNSVREKLKRAGSKAFNGLTPEMAHYRDAVMATVDNMDDRMAELTDRALDKANINWIDSQGTSNYSTGSIAICTRDINGDLRTAEDIAQTFWHEFGHFVDDGTFSEVRQGFIPDPLSGFSYRNDNLTSSLMGDRKKMYHEAAKKDVEALLDSAGLGDKYGVKPFNEYGGAKVKLFRKSDGKELGIGTGDETISDAMFEIQNAVNDRLNSLIGYDEVKSFMRDHGEPEAPKYSDYVEIYTTPKRHLTREREKFPGAREKFIDAIKEHEKVKETWIERLGGQDAYYDLLKQKDDAYKAFETRKRKLGYVTDSLDEATNGMFGMAAAWGGHDISYYERKSVPIETTANVFAMRARNDPDEMDFANKVIPGIMGLFTQAWRANYE